MAGGHLCGNQCGADVSLTFFLGEEDGTREAEWLCQQRSPSRQTQECELCEVRGRGGGQDAPTLKQPFADTVTWGVMCACACASILLFPTFPLQSTRLLGSGGKGSNEA